METYLTETLFALLFLCLAIQLYFSLYYHLRLCRYEPEELLPQPGYPVSVIISARNEARNLTENLPFIMEQDYPDFEVVVINDCSLDGSEEVLKDFAKRYPHLKVVTVTEHQRFKTGKKFALTMGIKASKNEYLLFTDADCKPASANWIGRMASKFGGEREIILGYSPYVRQPGLLNALIRFETIRTAASYLSAALAGNPYMGIGRNLAYTKTAFFRNKGFASHMHVLSGDDDLFVNEAATSENTAIEIHPEAFTYSPSKRSWAALFSQKRRHMGAGRLYRSRHRMMLSLDAVSGFLFYLLVLLCALLTRYPMVALALLLVRGIVLLTIYLRLFKKMDGKGLIWCLPAFDLVYYVYLNIFGLTATFIKTTQWK